MTDFNNNDMTSGPVKTIHAGVNVKIATYLQEATVSAVGQINMMRLPGGAEVVATKLRVNGVAGTGLAVKDSHGNVYMDTATHAANVSLEGAGGGFGNRLTSSAHVYIEQNGIQAAQAGADSANFSLIVSYLTEKSGD